MRPTPLKIEIPNWIHNPAKRKHRFRCQGCAKLIADGSTVIIERRPGGAHGYHKDCLTGHSLAAVNGRNDEHIERKIR